MAGAIKPPGCSCMVCNRCKTRVRMQYLRAMRRGGQPPAKPCECGTCNVCRDRIRKAEERKRKAEAAANGVTLPLSPTKQRELETKARKEAQMQEWAELARRNREQSPLNPRQRKEVEQIVTRMLAAVLLEG